MYQIGIYVGNHRSITRSFVNMDDARVWAEGYCRRHPECKWEVL